VKTFAHSALFAIMTALTAAAVPACSSAPAATTEEAAKGESTIVVDAAAVDAVPADKSFYVDLGRADVVYQFDFRHAAIDFSRVALVFASGDTMKMSDWLAAHAANGDDFLARPERVFFLRPSESTSGPSATKGTDPCVTLCAWVCETPQGPCVYKCITNCGLGGGSRGRYQ